MSTKELIKPIIRSAAFPELLEKLNNIWNDEQQRRREFYNWVTPDMKAEFIEGEVVVHSPVKRNHNLISGLLYSLLQLYVIKNKLGFVGIEKIMIRLTRNDYEPDICFFSKSKSDQFEAKQTLFPAPDFIVEVLSPSTETRDRGVKMEDYARHGIQEYWIIDPDTEIIEQYLLDDEIYELAHKLERGTIESTAVEGFKIPVKALFSEEGYAEAMQLLSSSSH
ncbi:MAG: Uma2 family endonuclease [Bacteroidota bacterium]